MLIYYVHYLILKIYSVFQMLLVARIIVPYVYINNQGRNLNSHMQYIYRMYYRIFVLNKTGVEQFHMVCKWPQYKMVNYLHFGREKIKFELKLSVISNSLFFPSYQGTKF